MAKREIAYNTGSGFIQARLDFAREEPKGSDTIPKYQPRNEQAYERPAITEASYQQTLQPSLWKVTPEEAQLRTTVSQRFGERRHLREQLERGGPTSLTDAELLTIIMRTGSGNESITQQIHTLLTSYRLPELLQTDFAELSRQHALGDVKAAQLLALLEVARRLTLPSIERYQITSPQDAANLVMSDMAFLDHEELRVLVLDTKNYVAANVRLYQGTVNSSVVRASEIFRPAITRKCPSIIIFHNHPSGMVEPSLEDIKVTEQFVEAGKLLEIELLDHIIIGDHRFLSLKERIRW